MNKFKLEIITPNGVFFNGYAEELIVNLSSGEMEIMYHTLPMVASLSVGLINIVQNSKRLEAVCSQGFIRVGETVTILAKECKWPYEIDDAESEITRLNNKIKRAQSLREYRSAKAQLAMQLANLKLRRPDS